MGTQAIVSPSPLKSKKLRIYLLQDNQLLKVIDIGSAGLSDFTTNKSERKKAAYIARMDHPNSKQDWTRSGMKTAGFWAKHLLWNKKTLHESIMDTQKRFNINIVYQKD